MQKSETSAVRIRENVPAKLLSTLGIGADVEILFEPLSIVGLQQTLRNFYASGSDFSLIGCGSNILLPDTPYRLPLIHLGKEFSAYCLLEAGSKDEVLLRKVQELSNPRDQILRTEFENNCPISLLVFGGTSLMSLSRYTSSIGLAGLEFAAGIPASMGGAVKMNAGAHGSSIAHVINRVVVVEADGELRILSANEMEFDYRKSSIAANQVVVAAEVILTKSDIQSVRKKRASCLAYRRATQPLQMPSAGSIFKNPSQIPKDKLGEVNFTGHVSAAYLIELLKLKGFQYGGVGFSCLHANWIVRLAPSARASDVSRLIEIAREKTLERFGIELEKELVVLS